MNYLFIIPIVTGGLIQGVKVLIDFMVEKKFNVSYLWGSGGFPSVHSGIAASICTVVLVNTGIESIEFAIAVTFSFLFWYDAVNLRFEAGQHATFLNIINKELQEINHIIKEEYAYENLKERLGHTITEVIGGILAGIMITLILLVLIN